MSYDDSEGNYIGLGGTSVIIDFNSPVPKGPVLIIGETGTGMSHSFISPPVSVLKNKNFIVTDPQFESGENFD